MVVLVASARYTLRLFIWNSRARTTFVRSLRRATDELDDKVHDCFVIVAQAIRNGELRDPARLMGFVRTVVKRRIAASIEVGSMILLMTTLDMASIKDTVLALEMLHDRFGSDEHRIKVVLNRAGMDTGVKDGSAFLTVGSTAPLFSDASETSADLW